MRAAATRLSGIPAILLILLWIAPLAAQQADDIAELNARYWKLFNEKKLPEAAEVARRRLEVLEKSGGVDQSLIDEQLYILATTYYIQARYAEAEQVHKRRHELREKLFGIDSPEAMDSLRSLAQVYSTQDRLELAEQLHARRLATLERVRGREHPDLVPVLRDIAAVAGKKNDNAARVAALERALAITQAEHGDQHLSSVELTEELARHVAFERAAPLYEHALAMRQKLQGVSHTDITFAKALLINKYGMHGLLLAEQRQFAEAEKLYRRRLELLREMYGRSDPDATGALGDLVSTLVGQERWSEAEAAAREALAILESAHGMEHHLIGGALATLANVLEKQGRDAEAETLLVRRLDIYDRTPDIKPASLLYALDQLAALYKNQNRLAEAQPLLDRMRTLQEKRIDRYGFDALRAKTIKDTEEHLEWTIRSFGLDSPLVAEARHILGLNYFNDEQWGKALDQWRLSARTFISRDLLERHAVEGLDGAPKREIEGRALFERMARALWEAASTNEPDAGALIDESFLIAQRARASNAGAALAQMAARGAAQSGPLAQLIRQRQDLLAEWHTLDVPRASEVARPSEKRDLAAEQANSGRLSAIEERIGALTAEIKIQFPEYSAFASPEPLSLSEVQTQLKPDEVLVLFLDAESKDEASDRGFIWLVTHDNSYWMRSSLGAVALQTEVEALRCGLDATLWDDDKTAARCRDLLKTDAQRDANGNILMNALPFDLQRAHALYKDLLGRIEEDIRGKHLLIVPSEALTQLPFQVLVTGLPERAPSERFLDVRRDKGVRWLARTNAITILPAVSSLKALRRTGRPSAATRPLIGFGNPLLDGDPGVDPREAEWAKAARARTCSNLVRQQIASAGAGRSVRGVRSMSTRDGRAVLSDLRRLTPLPDTADELCRVGESLRLPPDDIYIGARATEMEIRRLSARTDAPNLASYRILHFATHGTLAGEITGTNEPGIVLTPPKEGTDPELDDGYLSASEVAALKLDADWVILSACNTAAGGAQGAEALSGLARAFIYAGARALLVSHWSVASESTVKLITAAIDMMAADKTVGRAEALRRSMVALMDHGKPWEAHPAYWAPFIVVGEGAVAE